MASRRPLRASAPKKKHPLLQLLRDEPETRAPEPFNVVQEYHKVREQLLQLVEQPAPSSRLKVKPRRSVPISTNKEHSPSAPPPSRKRKETKRISRPYTEMMQERVEYRRKLLAYLTQGEDEIQDEKLREEQRESRYRRYVQHGIGTEHIAPLQQTSINHILSHIPLRLKKNFVELLQSSLDEIKQDFITGVKTAVVEYVLHDSKLSRRELSSKVDLGQRSKKASASRAQQIETRKIQVYIQRNLHTINRCVAQLLDLWHKSFSGLRLVNVPVLSAVEHALELPAFKQLISHQIHTAVQTLRHHWFPALEGIFLQGCKRKMIPTTTSQRRIKCMLECVATLMTSQLQQLCVASIQDFTDFICDTESGHNHGFVLEVAYRNKLIVFDPSFNTYKLELLNILDMMVVAVKCVPRLETVLFEKLGMQPLPEDRLFLKPVVPTQLMKAVQLRLVSTLEEQRILPELRIQDFDPYISLINGEWQEEVERFLCTKQSYDDQVARVTQLHELSQTIPCDAWLVVGAGLFEVHRGPLVVSLVQSAIALRDLLLANMRADHLALSTQLSEEYESIAARALTPPANTAELMELKSYVAQVESCTVLQLEDRLRQVCQSMLFLVDHMSVSPSEVKQNAAPFQWYGKMPAVFEEHQEIVQKKTEEYQQALKVRTQAFVEQLALQDKQVSELQNLGDINELPRYLQRARTLQSRLHGALKDIEQFNCEEKAFGWETSEYPLRQQVAENLGPYMELYETSSGFLNKHDLWMSSQVGAFHPAIIESEVDGFSDTVMQLEKTFADIATVKLLVLKVRQRIEGFRENLPVVQTLGNPDMKERHWEKVSEIVGFPLKADETLTLAKIIDFGLGDYNNKFQIISESATKENNLEKALNQMVAEWAEMEFSVVPYRESGTHFLSSVDDIQLLLDDHIVKTQTMRGSPYIKPFEKEIAEWEANLMLLQEILDSWIKVQASWMYLEPIFSSPDIQAQMPEEGRRFGAVDKMWRDIMKVVVMDLHVLAVSRIDKMLERLHKSSDLLDAIQRGLNDYLDKKRLFFPRFFFLSNDELLEILSETKDPTRVQPHLRKCFRGIAQLSFTEDMLVVGMLSAEGEEVELPDGIDTAAARGQVEQWLQQLEVAMRANVHRMIKEALKIVIDQPSIDWVMEWPEQAALCVSQVQWTRHAERAMQSGSLSQFFSDCEANLSSLAGKLQENLTPHQRTTLGSLIIQDLHAKDVAASLVEEDVTGVTDFQWVSQLRYYWEMDQILVCMLNAKVNYGYEYLGDCQRLVMTPLTDRCFRALFATLHLQLGGVLEGPSSCGKTEIIKDLTNAVAKQCVVVNCSSGLDCIALGKLLKGVASSGAWICLDEFDRLKEVTLSAAAHQILAIQRAVRSKADTVHVEGSQLSLDSSCAIFATLPLGGYMQNKLQSNLKALLRPVAMTLPDFAAISQAVLFSKGFKNSLSLARKVAATYRLCANQLSSQPHYDHGMKSIKAVLTYAANKRLEASAMEEEALILQSINCVNKSKYLPKDLKLYQEIVASIFQDSEPAPRDLSHLTRAVQSACERMKLQCPKPFLERILHLYQLLQVRQGVILLGPPFSGKTTAYRVLASALATLEKEGEHKAQIIVINPKALTLKQLYGHFDPVSHEWSDGVLAICYRQLATSTTTDRKWLVFDSPIDSEWAENLNTVLDDNKRLFLMCGENCHLSGSMNLIFETTDLQDASPATVSRCGILYMDSCTLGWAPLLECWLNSLPEILQDQNRELITQLFERFCPLLLGLRKRKTINSLFPMSESNLVRSTMSLFDCFVNEFTDEKAMEEVSSLDLRAQLEGVFFYSCIWSMGGSLDAEGRATFDLVFRGLLAKEFPDDLKSELGILENVEPPSKPYIFPIPDRLTVFDYRYFKEGKGKWRPWEDEVRAAPPIPREIPVNQILVPTLETVRCLFLLQQLVSHGKPLLFVGPSGVGKSAYITDFLFHKVDQSIYKPLFILFSAHTSASEVQELVMNNLDKRRKGVYGPPLGKRCLVFVDDVNLPETINGSQPPVELLRQMLDHEAWFETSTGTPIKLMDLQLLCAMGPAPGGLLHVSPRFLRHFTALSINEFEDAVMVSIFSRLMLWHLDTRGFSKEFDPSIDELVAATLQVYKQTKAFLLPTPSKSHYIYNLRDFSRVIQGVLLSVPEAIESLAAMKRLWVHEVLRVFGDRIWDKQDREWLFEVLSETCAARLGSEMNAMFKDLAADGGQVGDTELRTLLFCDFANPKADSRNYGEITELEHLRSTVERYMNEFNNMTKKPTEMVMFRYAVEHMSRICRLLKQPRSHALLIGPVGSGRQSLARLAAHISYYELFQPEVTKCYGKAEWRDEIKDMIIKTGTSDQCMVLLFSDSQVKEEFFLEDINHLLCTGEIPNLLNAEEKTDIIEKMGHIDKQRDKTLQTDGSNAALLAFFLQKLRDQLHIVVCFNPGNVHFNTRLRKFPALVNYCTLNWFMPWPDDALLDVAINMLGGTAFDGNDLDVCTTLCRQFHADAKELCDKARHNLRIHSLVTPSSYTEFLGTFKRLLDLKRSSVKGSQDQHETAVHKVKNAAEQVPDMQQELKDLQPQLKEAGQMVEQGTQSVDTEGRDVSELENVVLAEEEAVAAQEATAQELQQESEAGLTETLPALTESIAVLETLLPADITALRGTKSPPKNLKLLMEAVCVFKDVKPEKVANPAASGRTMDDYWGPGKKLLGDPKFIEGLVQMDKDNIQPKASKQLAEKVLLDESFDPEKLKSISVVAEALCRWVLALYNYDCAAKIAAPKKQALTEVMEKLQVASSLLEEKRATLQEAQNHLSDLKAELAQSQAKREELQARLELCQKKLKRSEELLGGLGGETDRWTARAKFLEESYAFITGDVLVGAGVIAYLGPFTPELRKEQMAKWVNQCNKQGLACSTTPLEFSLVEVLGDPVEMRDWAIAGLPGSDFFCIDSGIIARNTGRWPLMIDPEGQANKWVRAMEVANQLQVIRLTDSDYQRTLESGIQVGKPVLLENMGEEIDSILEPLLLKQTFSQGSSLAIKLGESIIEYHPNFRFYMTTRLRKPYYSSEVASKVTIVNFSATHTGLMEQLLASTVARERPDLESEKSQLISQGAESKRQLRDLEDKILEEIWSSKGNILEDDAAVHTVSSAKTLANELFEKQTSAEQTELSIDKSRLGYIPVAAHAGALYFSITQLSMLDPMYQFSIAWFMDVFTGVIDSTERVEDLSKRLEDLCQQFTLALYRNVSLSLFEKDKMLFPVLLAGSLSKLGLDSLEWHFLLTHPNMKGGNIENPIAWLPSDSWEKLNCLNKLPKFEGLLEHIQSNEELWQVYFNSEEPQSVNSPWEETGPGLQPLLLLSCIRPDKLIPAFAHFIEETLGRDFIHPPPFNLATSYAATSCRVPLIFFHTTGVDPTTSLLKFADDMRVAQRMQIISLGEKQGPAIQRIVEEATRVGSWVLLQNCHLEPGWMSSLEKICDGLGAETTHPEFRLWIASLPSKHFPSGVLQMGIKMAYDPPAKLKDNMLRSYQSDPISDNDFFESCAKLGGAFRKLVFGTSFFHAAAFERGSFGSLGWNQPYKFTESDQRASLIQLQTFLSIAEGEVPFTTVRYLTGECYYGGHISDPWDQRCLRSLLLMCCGPLLLESGLFTDTNGLYPVPSSAQYEDHILNLKSMPIKAPPDVIGLNCNVAFIKDSNESEEIMLRLLSTQDFAEANKEEQKLQEPILCSAVEEILQRLPSPFLLDIVREKYPDSQEQMLNTILLQEMSRYNELLYCISESLKQVLEATQGKQRLSPTLENIGRSILRGQTPVEWKAKSYPSLKPLGNYVTDFLARIKYLQNWFDNGPPKIFWLPGFFFPQAFLTALQQIFAHKHLSEPIDKLLFDCEVMKTTDIELEDGALVHGLFLHGAQWDHEAWKLAEIQPRQFFNEMPTIWLKPNLPPLKEQTGFYCCPVYQTAQRGGLVSSAGISDNFLIALSLPSSENPDHWILRGAALCCQLPEE